VILAIDTATKAASLALYAPGEVRSEYTWCSHDNHTVELMPNLTRLLAEQRLRVAELTGLVTALGPGSFAGLRVGISVAKGLAFALHIPIVGIGSLEALAYSQAALGEPVWAVLRAGRGRLCAARYVMEGGRGRRTSEYLLANLEELCAQIEAPAVLCGELSLEEVQKARGLLREGILVASPASSLRRAGFLAELGWRRLEQGEADDPVSLSPIYLHHTRGRHEAK